MQANSATVTIPFKLNFDATDEMMLPADPFLKTDELIAESYETPNQMD